MSSNSIINNLTSSNSISEIKLLLFEPQHLYRTFIVLEGNDDCILLAPHLNEKTVLIESYGSKNDVIEIVKKVNKKQVIGIVDRDYDYKNYGKKIFYYDYSCAEMSIIQNDVCMKNILINLNHPHYSDFNQIRHRVLKGIEMLGFLRKLNHLKKWNVKFDGVKPSIFYHENEITRKQQMIVEVNTKSPVEKIEGTRLSLIDDYVCNDNLDYLLNISNGHDFLQLFTNLYAKRIGVKIVKTTLIARFDSIAFQATKLYTELFHYENRHGLKIC